MELNISIIIPVLNEEKSLPALLRHLVGSSKPANISEIIIVDGGSTDNTPSIIENLRLQESFTKYSIHFVKAAKGRAKQMNAGARKAQGDILYFLHADSYPPKKFDKLIIDEVEKERMAGCFKMKFDDNHWWLKLAGWCTQFKWRACRGGDQSQFITKKLFEEIGGYNEEFIIYEDNILINELYARNQFVVIQSWLTTSARLYREKGIWNLQYHFWAIYVKKWLGASAEELHSYYMEHITLKKPRVKENAEVNAVKVRIDN